MKCRRVWTRFGLREANVDDIDEEGQTFNVFERASNPFRKQFRTGSTGMEAVKDFLEVSNNQKLPCSSYLQDFHC
jgi:hypothetical protein